MDMTENDREARIKDLEAVYDRIKMAIWGGGDTGEVVREQDEDDAFMRASKRNLQQALDGAIPRRPEVPDGRVIAAMATENG